MKYSQLIEKCV
jgi:hypothetical protein